MLRRVAWYNFYDVSEKKKLLSSSAEFHIPEGCNIHALNYTLREWVHRFSKNIESIWISRVTSGKSHIEDPQILGDTLWNLVSFGTYRPGVLHPCLNFCRVTASCHVMLLLMKWMPRIMLTLISMDERCNYISTINVSETPYTEARLWLQYRRS
jgi:hypothetical protein